MCFSQITCQFLLICFKVRMPNILNKTDKFLLNYNNLFWGPLFIETQCESVYTRNGQLSLEGNKEDSLYRLHNVLKRFFLTVLTHHSRHTVAPPTLLN